MEILNVEIYNKHIRQVKDFTLTCKALEEKLEQLQYTGENRIKDEQVENMQLPPIALPFYSYIYDTGNIPTEDILIELYLGQEEYFGYLPEEKIEVNFKGIVSVVSLEGVIGRVLRTYPSLIRDFHFYLMSVESGEFDAVRYSFIDDFENKIDLKIMYKEMWFNIGLQIKSTRSSFFQRLKQHRHKPVDVLYIELDRRKCKTCGSLFLYTQEHLQTLIKTLNKKLKYI